MRLRWLSQALAELDAQYDYLHRRNPVVAKRVFERIVATASRLREFPNSGRHGEAESTRELVVPGFPYIVAYRVNDDAVEILRVFHDSMNWPPRMQ
jgi:addiction module RelE/StbE family toxin